MLLQMNIISSVIWEAYKVVHDYFLRLEKEK